MRALPVLVWTGTGELAKHVTRITMHRAEQNGHRNYAAQGDSNLLGNLTRFGDVRMVAGWVDLNHQPLGYECNHQQNLKTMRGAKSNALFLRGANCSLAWPCIALVI